ncbi:MAG: DUF2878 family protein [Planctomycetes bacterium]|nr:DUF2878 family protein [Planctomycetota bacterium]
MPTAARLRPWLLVAGQQAAWFACALSAAAGRPAVGLSVTLAFLAAHLATAPERAREALLLLAAALVGAAGDAALVLGGGIDFPAGARLGPLPAPVWMLGLWAAFAALLRGPLRWLGRDLRLAAAAGALAGPLAYRGGAALGALEVRGGAGLVAVGALYALALPALAGLARAGPPATAEVTA